MEKYMERYESGWTEDSVRLIATPSMTAKSAFFYMQEAGYFKTSPQYFTERAHLSSYLIVYTVSGKGYLKYKGNTYTLLPNQAFLIDCMEYHHYETDKEALWEILWVHFNGATSREYYELFAKSNSPVVTPGQPACVDAALREILVVNGTKSIHAEQLNSKLLVGLLTEFLLAAGEFGADTAYLPAPVSEIMGHLEKRFNEKIQLDDLAEAYSVSKFHMCKMFKRYTGFSVNEYLINTRINHAKELLKYSDYPVSEIAESVGIGNVSHFINLFKERAEVTPLAYRNKWRYTK